MAGACCGPPTGWPRRCHGGRPGAARRFRGYLLTELRMLFPLVSHLYPGASLVRACRSRRGIWRSWSCRSVVVLSALPIRGSRTGLDHSLGVQVGLLSRR